jgi:hypothetical protein
MYVCTERKKTWGIIGISRVYGYSIAVCRIIFFQVVFMAFAFGERAVVQYNNDE